LASSGRLRPLSELNWPERLNFLVTNRVPRQALTHLVGCFSRIESPLLARLSIGVWQQFVDDLRLHEAKQRRFRSLHECFTRELKAGSRPLDDDPDVLTSPCDAEIGAFGDVEGLQVLQAKGFPYALDELMGESGRTERHRDGRYVTLRLKSSMYHRFHAPCAGTVDAVHYISGDTWNVNPVALKVVERLYCRNERVVIPLMPQDEAVAGAGALTLVAVAAVLVASVRLKGLDHPLHLRYAGPNRVDLNRAFIKGEEMGYFEHGSTLILFTGRGYRFCDAVRPGGIVRMGQALLRRDD
jgi:phosphatidylserine decarboxylase